MSDERAAVGGEIDPEIPPVSTMVYLAAQQDIPNSDKEIFGIGLHFPRPLGQLLWFSFPVVKGNLIDETADLKAEGGHGTGFCFDMRDKIIAKLKMSGLWDRFLCVRETHWTSVAAAIRHHIIHWNKLRRNGDWNRVIH